MIIECLLSTRCRHSIQAAKWQLASHSPRDRPGEEVLTRIVAFTAFAIHAVATAQTEPSPNDPIEVIRHANNNIMMLVVAGPKGERIALTRDNRWKLIPPKETTVADVDGNSYRAVRIGWALWTIDNLRVTRLNDGTPISAVAPGNSWAAAWQTPARAQLSDDPTFGAVYNWSAVASGKLCPSGWRVPSRTDFYHLQNPWDPPVAPPGGWAKHVPVPSNVAKEDAWPMNFPGSNATGFSAVPAKDLQGNWIDGGGSNSSPSGFARFYTSEIQGADPWFFTVVSFREFKSLSAFLGYYDGSKPGESRTFGLSVRCVRNEVPANIFAEAP